MGRGPTACFLQMWSEAMWAEAGHGLLTSRASLAEIMPGSGVWMDRGEEENS